MSDNRTDLPEGTDTVIAGASNSGTGADTEMDTGFAAGGSGALDGDDLIIDAAATGTGATLGETSGVGIDESGVSAGGGATGSATGGRLMDRVRSGRERLSSQAGGKARGLVSQGLERGAEALANVGRLVGDTASGLEERLGPEYGDYARRAAGAIENTATSLASKDPDELIDDTREFVRRSPGVALAGAAIVGFAVARLVKSGFVSPDGEDSDGQRRGRRSSDES